MSKDDNNELKDLFKFAFLEESIEGPETETTDSEADIYREMMVDFGLKKTAGPKFTHKLAELIGQEEHFSPMNKVCSKIMHRTIFSIISTVTPGTLDEVIPLLAFTSNNYFLAYRCLQI